MKNETAVREEMVEMANLLDGVSVLTCVLVLDISHV